MKVHKEIKKSPINEQLRCFILVFFLLCVLILCRQYNSLFAGKYPKENSIYMEGLLPEVVNRQPREFDSCSGRYIYIHDLPSRFNNDILEYWSTTEWFNKSKFIFNMGFGPRVKNSKGILQENGWYSTNQFSLEIIFHNRMKNYKCLTNDSSLASAIYVPFYAGLEVTRHLWNTTLATRDAVGIDLMKWLLQRREWKFLSGRDHFFVAGRISYDFRRGIDDWGSNLMTLPGARNMTMLTIESGPWADDEYAIPYPTYFHPSRESEIFDWQNKVRGLQRKYLYSFVGASRPYQKSIRNEIIDQCIASKEKCKLLNCKSSSVNCDNPIHVMKMFESSIFCLQPLGDSPTRRSTFDAILAGCIPVFFNPDSAYNRYVWHFPKNYTKYSVFIPEDDVRKNASIEKILLRKLQNESEVLAMREEVIRLIPKVTYSSPTSKLETIEDAFDIAINKVIDRVRKIRKLMHEGKSSFDLSDNKRNVTVSELIN